MAEKKRRALLIGIAQYDDPIVSDLPGCLVDVDEMRRVLAFHGTDGQPRNFNCISLVSDPSTPADAASVRGALKDAFDYQGDEVLIYFSGHGILDYAGGYLVTQDGKRDAPGIYMHEIHAMAEKSPAKTITIIIDSCHSGAFGETCEGVTTMRDGMTVMGSSTRNQPSIMSSGGMSVFTSLVVAALEGGAANTRGHVSASSIYAYVDASLGEWSQRPIYKSHAQRVDPLRNCAPQCTDMELRELITHFPDPTDTCTLSPEHEETYDGKVDALVEVFQKLKKWQIAGLLCPVHPNQMHLYWVAMQSEEVKLTELGKFYHALVTTGQI